LNVIVGKERRFWSWISDIGFQIFWDLENKKVRIIYK
jgi:hypothetical protein